ncbi:MAG: DUF6249 domain-containing protein [Bacteroidota bacterium]
MEVAIIVPVVSVLSIVTLIIFIRKFINDERMAMIEKGVDSKIFRNTGESAPLRYGLLLIGIGIGLLFGSVLEAMFYSLNEEAGYFSMISLFGGLGLFLSYQIEQKKRKENGE